MARPRKSSSHTAFSPLSVRAVGPSPRTRKRGRICGRPSPGLPLDQGCPSSAAVMAVKPALDSARSCPSSLRRVAHDENSTARRCQGAGSVMDELKDALERCRQVPASLPAPAPQLHLGPGHAGEKRGGGLRRRDASAVWPFSRRAPCAAANGGRAGTKERAYETSANARCELSTRNAQVSQRASSAAPLFGLPCQRFASFRYLFHAQRKGFVHPGSACDKPFALRVERFAMLFSHTETPPQWQGRFAKLLNVAFSQILSEGQEGGKQHYAYEFSLRVFPIFHWRSRPEELGAARAAPGLR